MKGKGLTPRLWASFVLLGLAGQLAWTIENMYFNVFLYNTITTDPSYIAIMVAASAVAATVTTLFMGAVSDRAGRRKPFICVGYILWGLSTLGFAFISTDNVATLFPAANAAAMAAWAVIIMDCVMTFFGSTANDAAFNAYVTDTTGESNRARVESVLAILPLISMLIIFGGFDGMTQRGDWQTFFLIFGALVTLTGIASAFLLRDVRTERKRGPLLADVLYGFKPSVISQNRSLYIALGVGLAVSIAVQIFFPYFIVYIQHGLGIADYALILGIALIFASVVSVACGGAIDRIGKLRCILPCIGIMLVGLILMYFAADAVFVTVAGSILMSGYMLVTAVVTAIVRDKTPQGKAGMFQGIRMIFAVMLPMVIGPFIGAAVIESNPRTYVELGVVKTVPTSAVFLAAAIALVFAVIPTLLLIRKESKQ
ncbi:MAG: MFS transporter [Clostridia bacterium]|nr:MFS transporter [Clostridia bacterium]